MKNKTIFFTFLFCILFSLSSYAHEDVFYTATKNVTFLEEKQDLTKIMKVALFNNNLSDTVEPKVFIYSKQHFKSPTFQIYRK